MRVLKLLCLVALLAVSISGSEDKNQVTILFTSDVKGRIRPAG